MHGVSGTVMIGPVGGGPQRIDDDGRRPWAGAEVRLSDEGGRSVVSVVSDSAGKFSLAALPGSYRLHVVVAGKLPRCPPQTIVLPMNPERAVQIDCDSGMR